MGTGLQAGFIFELLVSQHKEHSQMIISSLTNKCLDKRWG